MRKSLETISKIMLIVKQIRSADRCSSFNCRGNAVRRAALLNDVFLFLRWPLVIALLIVPRSIAMGQKKYERPPVNTPDTFRGSDSPAPPDADSIGDLKWFEVFKDEQLQKLVRTAKEQNYDL